MTQRKWFDRRLVHTCTVTRNVGTGFSSSGEPQAVGSAISTAQACRYTETTHRIGNENGGYVFVRESWLQLPYDADIQARDTISALAYANGTAVVAGAFDVDELLSRRDIGGDVHHKSAKLVRVEVS